MTDREAGYIVTLEKSIREDDAEDIKTAIRMIKGVISVEPVVEDINLHIAKTRSRQELEIKLFQALKDE